MVGKVNYLYDNKHFTHGPWIYGNVNKITYSTSTFPMKTQAAPKKKQMFKKYLYES